MQKKIDYEMCYSAKHGDLEKVIEYFSVRGAWNVNKALALASGYGHVNVVKWLIENWEKYDLPYYVHLDLGYGIKYAIEFERVDVIKMLISYGFTNFKSAYKLCIRYNKIHLLQFFPELKN